jgi:serine/threonine-protein kinase RsbW
MSPTEFADLKLVVSELVHNAFLHGRGDITLHFIRGEDRVRIEVVDEGENAALTIREEGLARGGYGLRIVDKLALAWGAHEGTTHVWAELPIRRR